MLNTMYVLKDKKSKMFASKLLNGNVKNNFYVLLIKIYSILYFHVTNNISLAVRRKQMLPYVECCQSIIGEYRWAP